MSGVWQQALLSIAIPKTRMQTSKKPWLYRLLLCHIGILFNTLSPKHHTEDRRDRMGHEPLHIVEPGWCSPSFAK
jgi:hypothetical protein